MKKEKQYRGKKMTDKSYRYQAMTISRYNGKTYWTKSKPTLDEVYKHLDRYCELGRDILIYKYEVKYTELPDCDLSAEWNALDYLEFVTIHENYRGIR
ncbi:MAG TPA: hypothetical protein DCM10_11780 [Xanthomarina gelatinilytica]|nr:hypothetical protein [Xanthomarina gelatinilytica]